MMLSMLVLLGFLGLAVDVGYLELVKTRMQTAADAAALGGVQDLRMNGTGNIAIAAKADSALNGFTHGVDTVNITVNHPPLTGNYMTDQSAIEVTISQSVSTFFMQSMGFSAVTINARAVARQGSGTTCIYVLNPTINKAFSKTGSSNFASPCGIFVNSSDAAAMNQTGSGTTNTTPGGTEIVGSFNLTGSGSIIPTPVSNATRPSIIDPFATRTLPTLPATCDYTNFSSGSTVTLSPGVYCGGISLTGSSLRTFLPGLYIMNGGGFNMAGSGNGTGSGITIYLTGDASHAYKGVSINGSGTYTLSAPTSGTYEALLIAGDRTKVSSLGSSITGSAALNIDGVIYLPRENLTYTGSSSVTNYQVLVADTLTINGSTHIYNNYSSLSSGPPVKGGGLVSE